MRRPEELIELQVLRSIERPSMCGRTLREFETWVVFDRTKARVRIRDRP